MIWRAPDRQIVHFSDCLAAGAGVVMQRDPAGISSPSPALFTGGRPHSKYGRNAPKGDELGRRPWHQRTAASDDVLYSQRGWSLTTWPATRRGVGQVPLVMSHAAVDLTGCR